MSWSIFFLPTLFSCGNHSTRERVTDNSKESQRGRGRLTVSGDEGLCPVSCLADGVLEERLVCVRVSRVERECKYGETNLGVTYF